MRRDPAYLSRRVLNLVITVGGLIKIWKTFAVVGLGKCRIVSIRLRADIGPTNRAINFNVRFGNG